MMYDNALGSPPPAAHPAVGLAGPPPVPETLRALAIPVGDEPQWTLPPARSRSHSPQSLAAADDAEPLPRFGYAPWAEILAFGTVAGGIAGVGGALMAMLLVL